MTIYQAEQRKSDIEKLLLEKGFDIKELNVLIAPAEEHFLSSFQKQWRNTNYVVALQTFSHCDMAIYVEDLSQQQVALLPSEHFLRSIGIT